MTFVRCLSARNALVAAAVAVLFLSAGPRAQAEATLLIEVDSGKVLHAENATYPWHPASVTKLMTAYVTLKAVKARRISLNTLITVSPQAAAQAPSKMGFKPGTQLTVDNALKMLMVKSANDMAVTLAEGVGSSYDAFIDEMNATARRLGMTQTSYVNPNGLPAEGQVTSARDLAILARAMMRELPEYDFYWHIPAIKLGRRVMRNYNTLIDRYPGADGMKTGFICASGFNLVASATRNGRRLVAVVLGAPSSAVRAAKAAQLLERGFNNAPLTWLTPSLGNVDVMVPVAAPPPDLRDEMCGKHRKRPAAETLDEPEEASNPSSDRDSNGFSLVKLHSPTAKPSTLIGPLVASTEPIPVFVGPPKAQVAAAGKPARGAMAANAAAATAPAPAALPQSTTTAFAASPAPAWPANFAPMPTSRAATGVIPMPRPRPKPQASR
ncbi:MAG: D-alanyl-D-alanine carboxypeptidase family protein [Pseudorhodoplanes sp.]